MFPNDSRILIVDDMPTIRELVKSQLRSMGYTNFTEAKDGQDAYERLLKAHLAGSDIHLVISDWNMPSMTGVQLLKKVRGTPELAELPFILLTSESEKAQVTEAILAGVSQYIVKPFASKAFIDKFSAAWQKHNKAS